MLCLYELALYVAASGGGGGQDGAGRAASILPLLQDKIVFLSGESV